MSFPNTVQLSEEQTVTIASAQSVPLGTRGVTTDGRVFRYAQAGATALTAHKLVISAAQGPASNWPCLPWLCRFWRPTTSKMVIWFVTLLTRFTTR